MLPASLSVFDQRNTFARLFYVCLIFNLYIQSKHVSIIYYSVGLANEIQISFFEYLLSFDSALSNKLSSCFVTFTRRLCRVVCCLYVFSMTTDYILMALYKLAKSCFVEEVLTQIHLCH